METKQIDIELLKKAILSIDVGLYGDHIYEVRDSIDWDEEPFDGSAWYHPRVVAYSKSINLIEKAQEMLKCNDTK